ncbi:uncharacterized protein LOC123316432 [Coccinella septempunctata]|uniref:uncharacterized protein LOC123316432 n=1 Tax=Coccinella septempunctata TaxID=41139 RepID=UPI001D07BED4|nr:uncharacterized protein LOC123316432 [Coccinella septempunctata]
MLDEVDTSILSIIETESSILDGLDILESDGTGNLEVFRSNSPFVSEIGSTNSIVENTKTREENPSLLRKRKRKEEPNKNKNEQAYDEKEFLHKLKRELLEIEIYKNSLKAAELEKKLGLSPSKFTKKFSTNSTCGIAVPKLLEYDTDSE